MLSAVVITLNEEKRIHQCLSSLRFCDEIVVVDAGSTDGTVEIAKGFTERVFVEEWKGFGPQKQSAIQKARGEWILSIDADEEVSEALSEEIIDRLKEKDPPEGFLIPRKNLYSGRWLRYGGLYPDLVLRLFRKETGRFTTSMVHERVVVAGRVERLTNPIVHHAFDDLTRMIEKMNRYSSLWAEQMFRNGKRATPLSPFLHATTMFLKDYLIRGGFLDGRAGFNVALLKALGVYFKYQKLLEKMKNDEK